MYSEGYYGTTGPHQTQDARLCVRGYECRGLRSRFLCEGWGRAGIGYEWIRLRELPSYVLSSKCREAQEDVSLPNSGNGGVRAWL